MNNRHLATEQELRIVTDTMPAGAVRCSRDRRFLWVNATYARWLGRSPAELEGRPMREALGGAAMEFIEPYLQRVLRGERGVRYERLGDFPGAGRRWVVVEYTPTLSPSGEPDGWVALVVDIHDRKMAEEALRKAESRKDEFLAALAHELRNPLAPIRNAVAILGRKPSLDPEVAWSRGVIERQVDQLSALIEDLLDIERISRGRFVLRRESVALEAVIDMALESSRPHVNAAGHHLSVLLPTERVTLFADRARLAQAIATLLKNAARVLPERSAMSLSAQVEGRDVAITVEHAASPRGGEERGEVGMTLVEGITALHGGTLSSGGGVVTLRLPLGESAPAEAAERAAPEPEPAVPLRLRVMIADDNRDNADSLKRVLVHFGHEVRVAYDGGAAVRLGEEFRPRVAVLDIGMPGTNGYDVARALRRGGGGERLTLVALTGWGQEADRRRATEAGFDYHLTKPVDPATLNRLIAELTAK